VVRQLEGDTHQLKTELQRAIAILSEDTIQVSAYIEQSTTLEVFTSA